MHGLILVDVTPKPISGFNFDSHASHQPRHVNNRKKRNMIRESTKSAKLPDIYAKVLFTLGYPDI